MAGKDKVKFGIKNVHIHPMIDDKPVFGVAIPVPGAKSLSLDAQGDISKFYADNIVYYQTSSNNGYEGDLEVALIPNEVYEKVFNYAKDSKKVMTENASKNVTPFAMTFEEEGDQTGTKFVLFNCTATRPSRSLETVEESKEPTTQTLSVSAAPLKDGNVMSMTTEETEQAVIDAWHTGVYGYSENTVDNGTVGA